MRLPRAGIDTSVIALWLGHEEIETTQTYLHADLELKERALAKNHTGRPTSYLPSLMRSDYADPGAAITAPGGGFWVQVGITWKSA
jgi:hypothetical protein